MNQSIFYFFYNFAHQSEFFDWLVTFTAETFPYIVILAAGLFLLFHHEVFKAESPMQVLRQKYKEIILVFFSGAFAWTIAHVLKSFFHTPRPFAMLANVQAIFPETGFAFPSGHATFFMALAFAIYFSHKKAGYVFMFFALLIGLSRIVAGVHFPVDILGGFILGVLVAYGVNYLYRRFANSLKSV